VTEAPPVGSEFSCRLETTGPSKVKELNIVPTTLATVTSALDGSSEPAAAMHISEVDEVQLDVAHIGDPTILVAV